MAHKLLYTAAGSSDGSQHYVRDGALLASAQHETPPDRHDGPGQVVMERLFLNSVGPATGLRRWVT